MACIGCNDCMLACPLPQAKLVTIAELNAAVHLPVVTNPRAAEFFTACTQCRQCVPACPADLEPRRHGPLQQDEGRGPRPELRLDAAGRRARLPLRLDARRARGARRRGAALRERREEATSARSSSRRRSASSHRTRCSARRTSSTIASACCSAARSSSRSAARADARSRSSSSARARSSARWPSWPISRSRTPSARWRSRSSSSSRRPPSRASCPRPPPFKADDGRALSPSRALDLRAHAVGAERAARAGHHRAARQGGAPHAEGRRHDPRAKASSPTDAYLIKTGFLRVSRRVEGATDAIARSSTSARATSSASRASSWARSTRRSPSRPPRAPRSSAFPGDHLFKVLGQLPAGARGARGRRADGRARRARQHVHARARRRGRSSPARSSRCRRRSSSRRASPRATRSSSSTRTSCVNCQNCVDACGRRHKYSRLELRGLQVENFLFPAACRHCEDPVCLLCSVNGIVRMPSGEITIVEDNCIGCGACAERCPYGNIRMHAVDQPQEGFLLRLMGVLGFRARQEAQDELKPGAKRLAVKCDLCAGLPGLRLRHRVPGRRDVPHRPDEVPRNPEPRGIARAGTSGEAEPRATRHDVRAPLAVGAARDGRRLPPHRDDAALRDGLPVEHQRSALRPEHPRLHGDGHPDGAALAPLRVPHDVVLGAQAPQRDRRDDDDVALGPRVLRPPRRARGDAARGLRPDERLVLERQAALPPVLGHRGVGHLLAPRVRRRAAQGRRRDAQLLEGGRAPSRRGAGARDREAHRRQVRRAPARSRSSSSRATCRRTSSGSSRARSSCRRSARCSTRSCSSRRADGAPSPARRCSKQFTKRLQFWRIVHVPLAFVFLFALLFHVLGAFDFHRKVVPIAIAESGPLAVFKPSQDCQTCHKSIYAQWADSMHAHALNSPLTVVQNNLDMRHSLVGAPSPDPRRMCINCHGPAVAAVTDGDTLPLRESEAARGHRVRRLPPDERRRAAGLAAQARSPTRSSSFAAIGTSPASRTRSATPTTGATRARSSRTPEKLCATCHNVHLNRDKDPKIVKGVDLVLQTTFDEYREYQRGGGTGNCVTCHMPVVPGLKSAADGAVAPFTIDYAPPTRAGARSRVRRRRLPARHGGEARSAEGEARGAPRRRGGLQRRHSGRRRPEPQREVRDREPHGTQPPHGLRVRATDVDRARREGRWVDDLLVGCARQERRRPLRQRDVR